MTTASVRPRWRRIAPAVAVLAATALTLSACAGSGTGNKAASSGATTFTYLANQTDPASQATLKALAAGPCKAANTALPLKIQTVAQASMQTKVQLLAGQNALPALFDATGTPSVTTSLAKSGQLLSLDAELAKYGVTDDVLPAAKSTIENLYGGKLVTLPTQLNVEGFWYNKAIFAKEGIAIPTTWDELVADSAKLKSAGIQPFATGASGQGWPVTRLISGYLFRELGPSAMADIRDGKAKLTDAKYVAAADAIAKLGKAGYFGKAVESVDYDSILSSFLTGKSAIMYMGSWALTAFADKAQDKIGSDNIGFFAYPTVEGGTGSITQLPANVGEPIGLSGKVYNAKVGAWLKCIAQNYGAQSLTTSNTISGFKVNSSVTVAPLTKLVQDTIANDDQSLVWFEAYFSSKASTVSWNNVASLVEGKITGTQFMSLVQAAL